MTFGNRYGNLAKRPVELNNEGKLRAGCEKMPPIEAALSAYGTTRNTEEGYLTTDNCSYAPNKRHDGIRPWFMLWIPDKLTDHRLNHPYELSVKQLTTSASLNALTYIAVECTAYDSPSKGNPKVGSKPDEQ